MAQWVKVLTHRLGLTPGTHVKVDGENERHKLSSDLQVCTMACSCPLSCPYNVFLKVHRRTESKSRFLKTVLTRIKIFYSDNCSPPCGFY